MPKKRGLEEAPVHGRRVLVRVDFNVPLDASGQVADDRRLVDSLPTLNHLRASGARTILLSHLGRPDGHRDTRYSLRPVVHRLSQLLGQPVPIAEDVIGIRALEAATRLQNGDFLMLENLRFFPGEEANDPGFAAQLAQLGELFVEDAFGALHRPHASTVGLPQRLPAFVGLLVERELRELSPLLEAVNRPYVALIGGAKVVDKLPLLAGLVERADELLIGGALAFPFFIAHGNTLGATAAESGLDGAIQELEELAQKSECKIRLPTDVVVEEGDRPVRSVPVHSIPAKAVIRDIGPDTRARFVASLQKSRTVLFNGPLGVAEDPRFALGTREVLQSLGEVRGFHVCAGGDSGRVAQELGVAEAFSYVSTGGGATLEFVQGNELPGLSVLPNA